MGMFNYLEIAPEHLMPEDRTHESCAWQTKSIEPCLMQTYTVDIHGWLLTAPTGRPKKFTGVVRFYRVRDYRLLNAPYPRAQDYWIEYEAQFIEGRMTYSQRVCPEVDHLVQLVMDVRQDLP